MISRKAVAWDLDGVLVDSADYHDESWIAMAREFGVPYDTERDFKLIFGRTNEDIITSHWGVSDPDLVRRMADYKENVFRKLAVNLRPLPGAIDLMTALQASGWAQALGSSAPRENIRVMMEATGLKSLLQAIVSGDDVTKGKPDPQVFLKAFEKLRANPGDGVVVEDAPAGVMAGRSAGAATLGVTTTQTFDALRAAGADMIVSSLRDVGVDDFERLVEANRDRARD